VAGGLRIDRQRGSHVILTKPGLRRPVVVARHRQEIGPRLLAQILRGADIGVDEFLSKL
jgi:predicted RNA binding protein YcfA (HicA-like mRNA interferase family)